MRVLITNDDGYDAPGLKLLTRVARELFDDVTVVAPDNEMSGVGMALTLHGPLRLIERGPREYSVTGTPVDCMIVALGTVFADEPPELVLSGVNRGPNLGYDVYYSGTVAAAREALINNIPAIGLSLAGRRHFPFDEIAPALREVLDWASTRARSTDWLLNVNIPAPDAEAEPGFAGVPGIRGLRATTLGHRFYSNELIVRQDPRGRDYLWIGGSFPKMADVDGSDCNAVRDGYISVTPVELDTTARDAVASLGARIPTAPSEDGAPPTDSHRTDSHHTDNHHTDDRS